MTINPLRNPSNPLSHLPTEGSEEVLIKEKVEEEADLVNLDNRIEEIDSPVIEEDLDLEDPL